MLHGKVPAPALARYMELHSHKDAIIPNILVHNFPSDRNENRAVSVEAIFDVKTLRIDKNAH